MGAIQAYAVSDQTVRFKDGFTNFQDAVSLTQSNDIDEYFIQHISHLDFTLQQH